MYQLNAMLEDVKSDKIKIKSKGLMGLQEYLNSHSSALPNFLDSNEIILILKSLISCMTEEFRRVCVKSGAKRVPVASHQIAAAFENVTRSISSHLRSIVLMDDKKMTSLKLAFDEFLTQLIRHVLAHELRRLPIYYTACCTCLVTMARNHVVVSLISIEIVRGLMKVLLHLSAISVGDRIRSLTFLAQYANVSEKSPLIVVIIAKVSSEIASVLLTNDLSKTLAARCSAAHCFGTLAFQDPSAFLWSAMRHPSVWVVLHDLINNWNDFPDQRSNIQLFRLLFNGFQLSSRKGKSISFQLVQTLMRPILYGLLKILPPYIQANWKDGNDSLNGHGGDIEDVRKNECFLIPQHLCLIANRSKAFIKWDVLIAVDLLALVLREIIIHDTGPKSLLTHGTTCQQHFLTWISGEELYGVLTVIRLFELSSDCSIINKNIEALGVSIINIILPKVLDSLSVASKTDTMKNRMNPNKDSKTAWNFLALNSAVQVVTINEPGLDNWSVANNLSQSSLLLSPRIWPLKNFSNNAMMSGAGDKQLECRLLHLLEGMFEFFIHYHLPALQDLASLNLENLAKSTATPLPYHFNILFINVVLRLPPLVVASKFFDLIKTKQLDKKMMMCVKSLSLLNVSKNIAIKDDSLELFESELPFLILMSSYLNSKYSELHTILTTLVIHITLNLPLSSSKFLWIIQNLFPTGYKETHSTISHDFKFHSLQLLMQWSLINENEENFSQEIQIDRLISNREFHVKERCEVPLTSKVEVPGSLKRILWNNFWFLYQQLSHSTTSFDAFALNSTVLLSLNDIHCLIKLLNWSSNLVRLFATKHDWIPCLRNFTNITPQLATTKLINVSIIQLQFFIKDSNQRHSIYEETILQENGNLSQQQIALHWKVWTNLMELLNSLMTTNECLSSFQGENSDMLTQNDKEILCDIFDYFFNANKITSTENHDGVFTIDNGKLHSENQIDNQQPQKKSEKDEDRRFIPSKRSERTHAINSDDDDGDVDFADMMSPFRKKTKLDRPEELISTARMSLTSAGSSSNGGQYSSGSPSNAMEQCPVSSTSWDPDWDWGTEGPTQGNVSQSIPSSECTYSGDHQPQKAILSGPKVIPQLERCFALPFSRVLQQRNDVMTHQSRVLSFKVLIMIHLKNTSADTLFFSRLSTFISDLKDPLIFSQIVNQVIPASLSFAFCSHLTQNKDEKLLIANAMQLIRLILSELMTRLGSEFRLGNQVKIELLYHSWNSVFQYVLSMCKSTLCHECSPAMPKGLFLSNCYLLMTSDVHGKDFFTRIRSFIEFCFETHPSTRSLGLQLCCWLIHMKRLGFNGNGTELTKEEAYESRHTEISDWFMDCCLQEENFKNGQTFIQWGASYSYMFHQSQYCSHLSISRAFLDTEKLSSCLQSIRHRLRDPISLQLSIDDIRIASKLLKVEDSAITTNTTWNCLWSSLIRFPLVQWLFVFMREMPQCISACITILLDSHSIKNNDDNLLHGGEDCLIDYPDPSGRCLGDSAVVSNKEEWNDQCDILLFSLSHAIQKSPRDMCLTSQASFTTEGQSRKQLITFDSHAIEKQALKSSPDLHFFSAFNVFMEFHSDLVLCLSVIQNKESLMDNTSRLSKSDPHAKKKWMAFLIAEIVRQISSKDPIEMSTLSEFTSEKCHQQILKDNPELPLLFILRLYVVFPCVGGSITRCLDATLLHAFVPSCRSVFQLTSENENVICSQFLLFPLHLGSLLSAAYQFFKDTKLANFTEYIDWIVWLLSQFIFKGEIVSQNLEQIKELMSNFVTSFVLLFEFVMSVLIYFIKNVSSDVPSYLLLKFEEFIVHFSMLFPNFLTSSFTSLISGTLVRPIFWRVGESLRQILSFIESKGTVEYLVDFHDNLARIILSVGSNHRNKSPSSTSLPSVFNPILRVFKILCDCMASTSSISNNVKAAASKEASCEMDPSFKVQKQNILLTICPLCDSLEGSMLKVSTIEALVNLFTTSFLKSSESSTNQLSQIDTEFVLSFLNEIVLVKTESLQVLLLQPLIDRMFVFLFGLLVHHKAVEGGNGQTANATTLSVVVPHFIKMCHNLLIEPSYSSSKTLAGDELDTVDWDELQAKLLQFHQGQLGLRFMMKCVSLHRLNELPSISSSSSKQMEFALRVLGSTLNDKLDRSHEKENKKNKSIITSGPQNSISFADFPVAQFRSTADEVCLFFLRLMVIKALDSITTVNPHSLAVFANSYLLTNDTSNLEVLTERFSFAWKYLFHSAKLSIIQEKPSYQSSSKASGGTSLKSALFDWIKHLSLQVNCKEVESFQKWILLEDVEQLVFFLLPVLLLKAISIDSQETAIYVNQYFSNFEKSHFLEEKLQKTEGRTASDTIISADHYHHSLVRFVLKALILLRAFLAQLSMQTEIKQISAVSSESIENEVGAKTLVSQWMRFWADVNFLHLARAALSVGCPEICQFLVHISSQLKESRENTMSIPFKRLLDNNVPLELQLLVIAGHQLTLGLPDAFHGTLIDWMSPNILHEESVVKQQHWRRIAFSSFPAPLTKSFFDTEKTDSLMRWQQRVGIPIRKSSDLSEAEYERLWREAEWDSAESIFCSSTSLNFHQGIVESCQQLESITRIEKQLLEKGLLQDDNTKESHKSHITRSALNGINRLINSLRLSLNTKAPNETLEYFVSSLHHSLMLQSLSDWSKTITMETGQISNLTSVWVDEYQILCDTPTLLSICEPVVSLRRKCMQMKHRFEDVAKSSNHHDSFSERRAKSASSSLSSSVNGNSLCHQRSSIIDTIDLKLDLVDCKALHVEGLHDAALVRSLLNLEKAEKMLDIKSDQIESSYCKILEAQWQCLQGFWDSNDQRRALKLGQCVAERLRAYLSSSKKFPSEFLGLSVTILATIGRWAYESQIHSIAFIEESYFIPAISMKGDGEGSGFEGHRIYAEVLDEILKTRLERHQTTISENEMSYEQKVKRKEMIAEQMQKLMKSPKNQMIEKQIKLFKLELEKLDLLIFNMKSFQKKEKLEDFRFAKLAVTHYIHWIIKGNRACRTSQTFRVCSRILTIWFEFGPQSIEINNLITSNLSSQNGVALLSYFRYFIYQIGSRVEDILHQKQNNNEYQRCLHYLLSSLIQYYPFHSIYPLLLLKNGAEIPTNYRGRNLFSPDERRIKGAIQVLKQVSTAKNDPVGVLKHIIDASELLSSYFMHLANLEVSRIHSAGIPLDSLPNYKEMEAAVKCLPVPTATPDLPFFCLSAYKKITEEYRKRGCSKSSNLLQQFLHEHLNCPTISSFKSHAELILSGISRPRSICVMDSTGKLHKQIVKGRDDLRQDAIMMQLFTMLNQVFSATSSTRDRGLSLRTYLVIPLSPLAGIVQWVVGTRTIGNFLVGEKGKAKTGAHGRYFPSDMTYEEARIAFERPRIEFRQQRCSTQMKDEQVLLHASLLRAYKEICNKYHPVMDKLLMELFPYLDGWAGAIQRYNRSLSITSMVGYIMGISDRHTNNILIDSSSGELIHIDFGMSFDKGHELPIPEVVPFRLTRDMLSGLGPLRLEGFFRMNCEVTLEVLRNVTPLVVSIVEVFVFDPLYSWMINPRKTETMGSDKEVNHKPSKENRSGRQALQKIKSKLLGLASLYGESTDWSVRNEGISVSSLVERLFHSATSEENLSVMFVGWSPWV